jgi:hypothetical protein
VTDRLVRFPSLPKHGRKENAMPKDDKPAEHSAPRNETAEALREVAREIAAATTKQNPGPLSMSGLSEEAQRALVTPPPPKSWRMVPGRSEETKATFTMHVQASRKFPDGVITRLHDYKHPPGIFQHQTRNADGDPTNNGLVPEGLPILADPTHGVPVGQEPPYEMLSPMYLQWRYENFYKQDLAYYINRGLRAEFCAHPDGMRTPWQEGTSGGQSAADLGAE